MNTFNKTSMSWVETSSLGGLLAIDSGVTLLNLVASFNLTLNSM